jgi:hypothetical protein
MQLDETTYKRLVENGYQELRAKQLPKAAPPEKPKAKPAPQGIDQLAKGK